MSNFRIFLILLTNCLIPVVFSQQHNFKSWSVESGIQSQVTCIKQDKRGYIWVGTSNGGIALFDGKKYIFYSKENGLSSNNITALCEDKKGNMWVGTQNGIDKFNGYGFEHIDTKDSVWADGNKIRDMICDHNKKMWIATEDGICIYDEGKFSWIKKEFGLSHRKVYKLFEDSKGNIWFGFKPGKSDKIAKYDGKKVTHYDLPLTKGDFLVSFAEDQSGKIWVGVRVFNEFGKTQVYTIENEKVSGFFAPFFDQINVGDLIVTSKGNLFIGTSSGAIKASGEAIKGSLANKGGPNILIKNNSYTIMGRGTSEKYDTVFMFDLFNKRHGLMNNIVNRVFEDKEKNIWFGTDYGVVKFSSDKFLNYKEDDNIKDFVFSINEDNSGVIWIKQGSNYYISTPDGFVSVRDSLKRRLRDEKIEVRGFLCSRTGEIWLGSRFSDVLRISKNQVTRFKREGSLNNMGVKPLCEDRFGNIWFGASNDGRSYFLTAYMPGSSDSRLIFFPDTLPSQLMNIHAGRGNELFLLFYGGGIKRWKEGKILEAEGTEQVKSQSFYSPFTDAKGNLWMRDDANTGIYKYTGKTLSFYNADKGFTNDGTICMINDKFGNLWIGTDGDGVFRYDGKDFNHITTKNGLNNNTVMSFVADDLGNIWTGTNKGINCIRLNKNGEIEKIVQYGHNEGFVGIECNDNAAFKDSKGCLWFGTSGLLSKYDPREDEKNETAPQINFTGLNLFYEKVDWKNFSDSVSPWSGMPLNLTLPYNQNHLTFSFVGIFHRAPERVRYRFMLAGEDTAWSKETDKTEITYSNLAPGKYVFKLLAGTTEGKWTTEPETFTFEILYPWWRRWWAYSIYVILGATSIVSFIRYRTKKLVEEKQRLEVIVEERTSELKVKKEIIEEKNKEILDSMRYASRIQRALLTSEKYIHRILDKKGTKQH